MFMHLTCERLYKHHQSIRALSVQEMMEYVLRQFAREYVVTIALFDLSLICLIFSIRFE